MPGQAAPGPAPLPTQGPSPEATSRLTSFAKGLGALGPHLIAAGAPTTDPSARGKYISQGALAFQKAISEAKATELARQERGAISRMAVKLGMPPDTPTAMVMEAMKIKTGRSLAEFKSELRSQEPTNLMKDFAAAKEAKELGFTGTLADWSAIGKTFLNIPAGYQLGDDDGLKFVKGGPADPEVIAATDERKRLAAPPTPYQGKSQGFWARMERSNDIIEKLPSKIKTEFVGKILSGTEWSGFLRSEDYLLYDQAKRNFVNALLREESGAAIGPAEFSNAEIQYFPQPGDTEAVIAQKKENRGLAMKAMAFGGSPAWKAEREKKEEQKEEQRVRVREGGVPDGVPPKLWAIMTDKEKAAWLK
jgi:hypothetical protein